MRDSNEVDAPFFDRVEPKCADRGHDILTPELRDGMVSLACTYSAHPEIRVAPEDGCVADILDDVPALLHIGAQKYHLHEILCFACGLGGDGCRKRLASTFEGIGAVEDIEMVTLRPDEQDLAIVPLISILANKFSRRERLKYGLTSFERAAFCQERLMVSVRTNLARRGGVRLALYFCFV